MQPYWAGVYGNTSSAHSIGRAALKAVDQARQTCAEVLGCDPAEIVFTGSGTESDNLALRGVAWAAHRRGQRAHIVTTPIEHHAVGHTVEQLRDLFGVGLTLVPVDEYGRVNPDAIARAIQNAQAQTVLVSVMYANNEIGTIQPLADIGRLAHAQRAIAHTDAVQAGGALSLKVDELGVDLLALSAHKFYGPKGVGLLYVRRGVELTSALTGGGHERGRRPGTLNVAGIVGLATALRLAQERREVGNARVAALRDKLIVSILARVPEARLTGHPTRRLPNSASFAVKGVDGESLLMALDLEGICVSTGSACATGESEPSFVLTSIGLEREWALGGVRLTLGYATTEEDIDAVLGVFPRVVERLRTKA
jgi:cysteine desulfurase